MAFVSDTDNYRNIVGVSMKNDIYLKGKSEFGAELLLECMKEFMSNSVEPAHKFVTLTFFIEQEE